MTTIFDEIKLNKLQLKNRAVRSATWEALAKENGGPSEKQINVYEELAKGGVGLIITGFTSVDDNDDYFGGMARISNDSLINEWKQLVDKVHEHNTPIIMQLALGEFVRNNYTLEPDDLTQDHIKELIKLFGKAAKRAQQAGFDGVQIHAAHNFYLSRFISPAYNHRNDAYGGSTKNRAKLLVDILHEIRNQAPNIHVTMKINCSDFIQGGLSPQQSLETILIMESEGLDSVEISGNGTSVAGIKAGVNEGYFLPFAKELKKVSHLPIILVGGYRSLDYINKTINDEHIDMISISRPLIREPNLINRWKEGDTAVAKCVSCNACYSTPGHKCIFVLNGYDK